MRKKLLRTISSYICKMFIVIIWIYKSFTFHLFGNGRLLRRLIWIHLYIHSQIRFVPTFTTPDCPRWQYWTNFPPYCFFAKIIPRLHSSYMFHQSCAFCFVLILPLAQSGKYSYITSLKLWLFFLFPGLSFQGSTLLIHFSIYQFIHSLFPIDKNLIQGVQLGLDVV